MAADVDAQPRCNGEAQVLPLFPVRTGLRPATAS
jgi:hypothetical protein